MNVESRRGAAALEPSCPFAAPDHRPLNAFECGIEIAETDGKALTFSLDDVSVTGDGTAPGDPGAAGSERPGERKP